MAWGTQILVFGCKRLHDELDMKTVASAVGAAQTPLQLHLAAKGLQEAKKYHRHKLVGKSQALRKGTSLIFAESIFGCAM